MADASIPVDLLNPGQVFACLGLMEAVEVLCSDVKAGFDWSDPDNECFRICASGDDDPVATVLEFLRNASVTTIAPAGSGHDTAGWRVSTTELAPDAPFPFREPSSPATLPASLSTRGHTLTVDHWGDGAGTRRDNVKFWAGSGGYPGAALLRDALDLIRDDLKDATEDPFSVGAPQSSSFRFDWRRDYIPIDIGFSLNEHRHVIARGYPLVEVLAAIGLSHARPHRQEKLQYRYGIVGRASADDPEPHALVPPQLLRAALGGTLGAPFACRRFQMNLGWPGKKGQARCITTVTEDPTS